MEVLKKKQMEEIDGAVAGLGRSVTDRHVNDLTLRHMKRMDVRCILSSLFSCS